VDTSIKYYVGSNNIIDYSIVFAKISIYIKPGNTYETSLLPIVCLVIIAAIYIINVGKYFGMAFILAGCISNYANYLIWGVTIDYIQIGHITFNLSDVSIIYGILYITVIFVLPIEKQIRIRLFALVSPPRTGPGSME
jgi:lipoprotein signal peptidase